MKTNHPLFYGFLFFTLAIVAALPLRSQADFISTPSSCPITTPHLGTIESINKDLNASIAPVPPPETRNADLMKSTVWTFGPNTYTGFLMYIPLIQQTIGTDKNYDTPEFADALSKWQTEHHYDHWWWLADNKVKPAPHGVLDLSAFLFLKEKWENARYVPKEFKQEKKKQPIAPQYRYDLGRDPSQCLIGEKTNVAYEKMISAYQAWVKETHPVGATPDDLKVVASNRSAAHINYLLSKMKDKRNIGFTQARNSVHKTGRALDIYVGGDSPLDTEDNNRLNQSKTVAYQWLVKNADKFGFKNYFLEPWHWEFAGDPKNE